VQAGPPARCGPVADTGAKRRRLVDRRSCHSADTRRGRLDTGPFVVFGLRDQPTVNVVDSVLMFPSQSYALNVAVCCPAVVDQL
jgi:hypothetical protein